MLSTKVLRRPVESSRARWVARAGPDCEDVADIEDEIRLAEPDERKAARQERSVPVLDRLMAYLREQKDGVLPKSMYAQAIRLHSEPPGRNAAVHRGRPAGNR